MLGVSTGNSVSACLVPTRLDMLRVWIHPRTARNRVNGKGKTVGALDANKGLKGTSNVTQRERHVVPCQAKTLEAVHPNVLGSFKGLGHWFPYLKADRLGR